MLGGCSSTQFFYNRLDTIIAWYVDDYVDFTDEQEAVFEAELETLFDWHRHEELPRYVALLEQAEVALDRELDEAMLTALSDRFRDAIERLRSRALNTALRVGETLSMTQLQDFVDELDAEQAELEEELLERDDETYREDTRERLVDNLEEYLGRLTKPQKALVQSRIDDYTRLDEAWLADRAAWNTLVRDILEQGGADWTDRLRRAAEGRRDARAEAFQRALDHNTGVTLGLVRDVLNQRSDRQDRRLRKRLAALKADFSALIPEMPPASVEQ